MIGHVFITVNVQLLVQFSVHYKSLLHESFMESKIHLYVQVDEWMGSSSMTQCHVYAAVDIKNTAFSAIVAVAFFISIYPYRE